MTLSQLDGETVRVYTLDGESTAFTAEKTADGLVVTLAEAGVYTAVVVE